MAGDISKQFTELLLNYLYQRGKQPDKVFDFIRNLNDSNIENCLDKYLKDYKGYIQSPSDYAKSLEVFTVLLIFYIERTNGFKLLKLRKCLDFGGPKDMIFEQFYLELKAVFSLLAIAERQNVLKIYKRNLLRKNSCFDELKFDFYQKKGWNPQLGDLYAYDPFPDTKLKKEFDLRCQKCDALYTASTKQSGDYFDEFCKYYLELWLFINWQDSSTLKLFQLLKWCDTDFPFPLENDPLKHQVHLLIVAVLYKNPSKYGALKSSKEFTDEEYAFLITQPFEKKTFFSNYKLQIICLYQKGWDELYNYSVYLLNLLQIGRLKKLELLSESETKDIYTEFVQKLRSDPKYFLTAKIWIASQNRNELKIGDNIGGLFVFYYEPKKYAYVFLTSPSLNMVLFRSSPFYVQDLGLLDVGDVFDDVYKRNKHILVLMPIFYSIIGYSIDLLTGGFTGLLKSIATNVITDYATEKIEKAGVPGAEYLPVLIGLAQVGHDLAGSRSVNQKGNDLPLIHDTATATKELQVARQTEGGAIEATTVESVNKGNQGDSFFDSRCTNGRAKNDKYGDTDLFNKKGDANTDLYNKKADVDIHEIKEPSSPHSPHPNEYPQPNYNVPNIVELSGKGTPQVKPFAKPMINEAGNAAEHWWSSKLGSPNNPNRPGLIDQGGKFSTPYKKNVEPDFIPAIDSSGKQVFGRNTSYAQQNNVPSINDSLLVADSKYLGVLDNDVKTITFGRLGPRTASQVKGMIWLGGKTKGNIFVFLIRPGQKIGKDILEFAKSIHVDIGVKYIDEPLP
jgi:hypothetical protein